MCIRDSKRPDAVAGGFNHIVGAAHIPEVAVLIPPGGVAGVVKAVAPGPVSYTHLDVYKRQFRRLGVNLTCEPQYQSKKLYHK